jgi:hypothetical protein
MRRLGWHVGIIFQNRNPQTEQAYKRKSPWRLYGSGVTSPHSSRAGPTDPAGTLLPFPGPHSSTTTASVLQSWHAVGLKLVRFDTKLAGGDVGTRQKIPGIQYLVQRECWWTAVQILQIAKLRRAVLSSGGRSGAELTQENGDSVVA